MKKKIHILLLLLGISATAGQAQIVLDTSFSVNSGRNTQLLRLEKSGYKYLIADYPANTVILLNMDHSLFKQFSLQLDSGLNPSLYYVTELLFDNDSSDVEFLLSYYVQAQQHHYLKVWDETGNLLFFRDSAMLIYPGTYGNMMSSGITNTDSGAIMMIYLQENPPIYNMEVYKLPGYMECSTCYDPFMKLLPLKANPDIQKIQTNYLNAYPNPSSDQTVIDYHLPQKYSQGTLKIIDMNGNLIRSYKISQQSKNITIEKGLLNPGMYNCVIEAGDQILSKKFIRVE
jgi:hypothetical protein